MLGHEVWTGALPVLVSLMGWVALLKGLTLLAGPRRARRRGYKGGGFERYFRVWMVAVLAPGFWITRLAFTTQAG